MGCLLWFYNLIHFLPLLSQWRIKYLDKLHRVITALDCNGKYNTYAVCVYKTASGIILDVATSVQVHSVFTSKTWGTYVLYLSLVVVIVVGYVSNKDYRKSLIYLPIYIYIYIQMTYSYLCECWLCALIVAYMRARSNVRLMVIDSLQFVWYFYML